MLLSVSGFKTNKTELNAVFDIFERENRDFIEYQEFIEAMKKKRHVSIYIIVKIKITFQERKKENGI